MDALEVQPSLIIPAKDLVWSASRAGGPGGQNVNKVASKVELRFDLAHTTALADDVRARLQTLARNRLDANGWIVISSQRTRDQSRNLDDARERLRELVLRALEVPKARKTTAPSRAVQRRRLAEKRHNAEQKRRREKPRGED